MVGATGAYAEAVDAEAVLRTAKALSWLHVRQRPDRRFKVDAAAVLQDLLAGDADRSRRGEDSCLPLAYGRDMKLGFAFLAVNVAAWAGPAFADMTAHYVGPNDTRMLTIEIATEGDLRMTFGEDPDYFLTRAGRDYFVKTSAAGPTVMRQEDIATAMIEQVKRKVRQSPHKSEMAARLVEHGPVSIRKRKGVAYVLVREGKRGADDEPFLVVSDDPDLAQLAAAMRRQFDTGFRTLHGIFGVDSPWAVMEGMLDKGAPLVFLGMQLDTIDRARIPASHFVLPASPITLDAVRRDLATTP